MTNLLGERAVQMIEGYARSRAPFFLSLHFTAPHWPWEGPDDEAESRRIRNILHHDGGTQRIYAAMVQSLDANVGRVLQALDGAGLAGNTIVVFASDNGGERFSNLWPFSGMKGELLEGGLRIPAIVRWPGRIAAGSVSDQVMITMDWLPTLLAAAGTSPDAAYPSDGENLGRSGPAARRPIRASFFGGTSSVHSALSATATGSTCGSKAMNFCSTWFETRARGPISRFERKLCSIGGRATARPGTAPCCRTHAAGDHPQRGEFFGRSLRRHQPGAPDPTY
jgi:hypothetical protein